jgi:hypothetical protein
MAPSLSRRSFLACLAITLAIFFGVDNPLLGNPFDIDRSIIWSYLPIPLLVAGALLLEKKLGWGAFALNTVALTLTKFALTYAVAITLWIRAGEPPPLPPPATLAEINAAVPAEVEEIPPQPPPATTFDPSALGTITGAVRDERGAPRADLLVFVASGLEEITFATPAEPLALTWPPRPDAPVAVVQAFQHLALSASDHTLHTAHAMFTNGERAFNRPLLASGAPARAWFTEGPTWVDVDCTVHGAAEPKQRVLVLAHPFAARTDSEGRFSFSGVPRRRLVVQTRDPSGRQASREVDLGREPASTLELRLD